MPPIGVAPIVGAYADRLPRRAFLVAMDGVRAGVALLLPFVDQIWQIYALIFILQSSSAAFTPTFQATIPDVLRDERDYPLAGQLGAGPGQATAFGALAALAALGVVIAVRVWPARDPETVAHEHTDLAPGHPHIQDQHAGGAESAHAFVIDDLHATWPGR